MHAKPPHSVVLDKDFAGVPKGAKLLISDPQEVRRFLIEQTRAGDFMPIQHMRRVLAAAHQCDATCPVSTAIFLRTVSEAAWDELQAGAPLSEIAPFWRVVEPNSTLAGKLRCGSPWIEQQRTAELEAAGVYGAMVYGQPSVPDKKRRTAANAVTTKVTKTAKAKK
jgi:hypothetical protein